MINGDSSTRKNPPVSSYQQNYPHYPQKTGVFFHKNPGYPQAEDKRLSATMEFVEQMAGLKGKIRVYNFIQHSYQLKRHQGQAERRKLEGKGLEK